jgi:uncharacterized membrane protein
LLLALVLFDVIVVGITTALRAPALVRAPLALPLVIFLPGWALTERSDGGMDGFERVAAATGLSLAVAALTALLLNLSPWGVRPLPWAVVLGGITAAATVLAAWTSRERRPSPGGSFSRPRPASLLMLAAAAGVVVLAVVVAREGALRQSTPGFTQFWMQPGTGAGTVALGVTNHEHATIAYRVRLTAADRTVGEAGPFTVADGATWSATTPVAGETPDQPITATLYRVDQPGTAYRQTTFWPAPNQAMTRVAP